MKKKKIFVNEHIIMNHSCVAYSANLFDKSDEVNKDLGVRLRAKSVEEKDSLVVCTKLNFLSSCIFRFALFLETTSFHFVFERYRYHLINFLYDIL